MLYDSKKMKKYNLKKTKNKKSKTKNKKIENKNKKTKNFSFISFKNKKRNKKWKKNLEKKLFCQNHQSIKVNVFDIPR